MDELLVSQPDTGEQALEITETLIRSGGVDIVVVDSVAALVPRAEIEGEMGDSFVGIQARLMSQALRKLTGAVSRSNTALVFTNQLREKIGVMFGNPETTPGGRALKFYASVRLDIRRVETIKTGTESVGNRVRVKVVKNKVSPPFRVAEFDVMYGEGISKEGGLLDVGVAMDVVTKTGAWFTFDETRLGQGREASKEFLKTNTDVAAEIDRRIRAKMVDVALPGRGHRRGRVAAGPAARRAPWTTSGGRRAPAPVRAPGSRRSRNAASGAPQVEDVAEVLDAAARFLEARPRSVHEVRRKLTTMGYRAALVDEVVVRLDGPPATSTTRRSRAPGWSPGTVPGPAASTPCAASSSSRAWTRPLVDEVLDERRDEARASGDGGRRRRARRVPTTPPPNGCSARSSPRSCARRTRAGGASGRTRCSPAAASPRTSARRSAEPSWTTPPPRRAVRTPTVRSARGRRRLAWSERISLAPTTCLPSGTRRRTRKSGVRAVPSPARSGSP